MRELGKIRLFEVEEVAELIGIKKEELIKLILTEKLFAKKIGENYLILEESLLNFLSNTQIEKEDVLMNNDYDLNTSFVKVFPHKKEVFNEDKNYLIDFFSNQSGKSELFSGYGKYWLGDNQSIGNLKAGQKILLRWDNEIIGEAILTSSILKLEKPVFEDGVNYTKYVMIDIEKNKPIIYKNSIPIYKFLELENKKDNARSYIKLEYSTYEQVYNELVK